ncbi:MAG: helical backbone metal receptor [Candidatus Omnitrophota bacterium]|nr:helical backbone metal receptor [Candidatus Omnitrophota bacterium]
MFFRNSLALFFRIVLFLFIPFCAYGYPERIISLSPVLTEELYVLGAEDSLVGCTIYCSRPAEAKNKEKVGTVIEINLEKIISLKPDVVLSTPLVSRKSKEKLKNLGIKIIDFPAAKNFSGICDQFLELGKIIGKELLTGDIILKVKDEVAAIKKKAKSLPNLKVFVQVGEKPLITAAKGSFINDFIEFAGSINIVKDSKDAYTRYSREKVIRDNPDVIIIASMGIEGVKEKEIWQRYKTLEAVKNNRIYIIDSNLFCSPTPITFVETLNVIVRILYPNYE